MKVNAIKNNINFKGPLDGVVTNALRVCDTNEVVNAVGLDIGAMVIPRSIYDTKARNSYAGGETFFRELSGTFINCLSAGIFAQIISTIASKHVMKDVQTKPQTWYSNDTISTLNEAWNKTKDTKKYVTCVLNNIEGQDGHKTNKFKDIDWKNVNFVDEKRWEKINWDNPKYKNIQNNLKTKEDIVTTISNVIEDKNITEKDKGNILKLTQRRITNALKAEKSTELKIGDKKVSASLDLILRDTTDMAKDIFINKNVDSKKALQKITKVNKIKVFGAITASCVLGLTNQFINRKITEKRTGKKGFVGEPDFMTNECTEAKKDKKLIFKKLAASAGMAGMLLAVMKVKGVKDFAKKLEFTGPISTGNAIKTVYGANIIGRFIAADSDTELRESMTRDYLGFLNWLVLGGFVAKGAANLMDRKGKELFNYKKDGKGIKHWLNDITLKTHNEIAAIGGKNVKSNIRKLNIAHATGIAYSALALGIGLPMLNAKITEYKCKKGSKKAV